MLVGCLDELGHTALNGLSRRGGKVRAGTSGSRGRLLGATPVENQVVSPLFPPYLTFPWTFAFPMASIEGRQFSTTAAGVGAFSDALRP